MCVGFLMCVYVCGFIDNCVGVLVICVVVFTVYCIFYLSILFLFLCLIL